MAISVPGWVLDLSTTRSLLERHGLWFVDVPRTSSTSVRAELARRFGAPFGKKNVLDPRHVTEQYVPDHLSAQQVVETVGRPLWDQIFTFSIVRNPWDRTLSMFFYRRTKRNIPDEWSFRDYVAHLAEPKYRDQYFKYHGHRAGASDFLTDSDGDILVDVVVRYESRDVGLKAVGERCGIPALGELATQRASPVDTVYADFYNDETREIVGEIYHRDVALFGYEFS